MRYWINTISRGHVQQGVTGGFIQVDDGNDSRLKRLAKGDRIVFYSPRADRGAGEVVQRFAAVGEVLDEAPYPIEATAESEGWRRQVRYPSCIEAPIQPLVPGLEFIRNKQYWGVVFRRGFFEIGEADFTRIARAMNVFD